MVDTQRFQLGPACVRMVTDVAHALAKREEGRFNALQLTSYLPLDVESVARILDVLEEEETVLRLQDDDGLCHYEISELQDVDFVGKLEKGAHLEDCPAFMRNLNALRQEGDWLRRVREQHELLRLIAGSRHRTVELGYLTSRTEIPSARIQSLLNDLGAEGYVDIEYDEDEDSLSYTFPRFQYPDERFERNMAILEQVESKPGRSQRYWLAIVVIAVILLLLVILTRFR